MWAATDGAVWVAAIIGAVWLRLDFSVEPDMLRGAVLAAVAAVLLQTVVGYAIGPYAVGHTRGSFEEVVDLGVTVSVVGAGLLIWVMLTSPYAVPRGVPVMAGAVALLLMYALRFVWRTARTRPQRRRRIAAVAAGASDGVAATRRVVVFGAGEAGRRLLRSVAHDGSGTLVPVALLDDDRSKSRLRIEGVRVRGNRHSLTAVAQKHHADTLVIALPNADSSLLRDLAARADAAGLQVLSLPPMSQIVNGRPTAHDLRDLDVADLLGRRPVQLDSRVIAEQLAGRRVLVTGAGGSIGSELCRQIARFGPERLYMLDRDESGLQATQMSIAGHGLLDSDELVLADIRDERALTEVFERTRPDVVFHAAALKHLPLLEAHPLEAWKSNVVGTLNVLTAAAAVGVSTFVNISTDKAANPSCVLGYSKRVAERVTSHFAGTHPGTWVSVRFGNVLGSRGSVVHAFTAQIERGGPVTVTHPDVRRFFMLIPEACQLVLEAAAIGSDGDVMVLEMGEQVRILEVAETLIRMSGRTDVEIAFTGLRPGEKIAEELFSDHEAATLTDNALIRAVTVAPLDTDAVRRYAPTSHRSAHSRLRRQSGVDPTVPDALSLHPSLLPVGAGPAPSRPGLSLVRSGATAVPQGTGPVV
ncbi:FlaA1/EpsC-like NDP-sugar epimerase [Terracoccus luteus]|uniref:FlaA1/EpsC-like NDP-sugar epimerase n=1 Tax=Terracoccus luteus TaxID=53356 RepID=A0A495Y271_9MICO|nr:nucleoside-diphosphate sugar epimerase/dehydratase [Terracoccus luteus]RKT79779.1 FlaA1/EpsC-like NDP-sugar epimerase [Terracoccus luteus]